MMKQIFVSLVLLLGGLLSASAQQKELKFNKDGKFKIVQLTDLHFVYGDPRADVTLERANEVLDAEKPDLVLYTGDIVTGKPAEEGLRTMLQLSVDRKIPYGIMFGNHDDEQGLTRGELFDIAKAMPYNLSDSVPGVHGACNYTLVIKSSDGRDILNVLYCMDSNAYCNVEGVGGYDYIHFDQVEWYRRCSKEFTKYNGGVPVPSLAFFHIPLPEYNQAAADEKTYLIGTRREKSCSPALNTGMFASMKEMGDVQAVFVGHDHDDDFAAYWKGILLTYGRYSGGQTSYFNLPEGNGARVIELTEGEEGFKTWIRLKGGKIINEINFPSDFKKKKQQ